jgi:hypothetical protein
MKRNDHAKHDEISSADTAALSAEKTERSVSRGSLRRKSTDHYNVDVHDRKRHGSLAEVSGEDNRAGSTSKVRRRSNRPMHAQNGKENGVEVLDLKAPAPLKPNQFTAEDYEERILEYECEIMRLEKLNATLSANVSALYAENAAAEEEICIKGSKKASMEMSPDDEYPPIDKDMILTEDQYLHEITKLQRSNCKDKKQLETQKKLVSKLSLHLKTSADKINSLIKEKDEWKTKFENAKLDNDAMNAASQKAQDDQNAEVHKYQIQVIENELTSLHNLMRKNLKANGIERQRLLNEYRNEDALWTSKLERPMDTMKRIIRSLGTVDSGSGPNTANEAEEEAKWYYERKESAGSTGFNILMDSVTSLFGQSQYQRRQSKGQADELPSSNETITYADVFAKGSPLKQEQKTRVLEETLENDVAAAKYGERMSYKYELVVEENVSADEYKDSDVELKLEDDEGNVDDSRNGDSIYDYDAESVSQSASDAGNNDFEAVCVEKEIDCVDEQTVEDRAEKVSNVIEPHATTDEDEEREDENEEDSSDDESNYDVFEGKKLGRLDSCYSKQESFLPTAFRQVDCIPNLLSSKSTRNDSGSISMGTYNTFVTGITYGTQARINAATEDKASATEIKTTSSNIINLDDGKRSDEEGDEEEDDDLSRYQNIISQIMRSESIGSRNSKKSPSRKQLFHRDGLSCPDVVKDVFHSLEEEEWKVLEVSKNGRDFVPPYKPPKMPTDRNKDLPYFRKGMKDGYYKYKSSSGNEYSGQWKGGRRHGYGLATYRDGEVFHGEWRRGRRHGHGVLHLSNKDVFDGCWDANQKHGLGIYYWADGEVDISWYDKDVRSESLRWNKDRRLAYLLNLKGSKKEQISLNKAAKIVREWEKKAEY